MQATRLPSNSNAHSAHKPDQPVVVDLIEGLDPQTPAGELFAHMPIEVTVAKIEGGHVRLGIEADTRFRILRDELCEERRRLSGGAA